MLLALLAALTVPLWQLALGPIIWGVAHVLSDVRYLVIRPGLHRRVAWLVGVAPLLIAVTVAGRAWIGFAAAAVAVAVSRAPLMRRVLGVAVAGALGYAVWRLGYYGDVMFAHLHNAVAVGLWWWWRPRAGRLHWVPLAAFVGGTALLLSGLGEPLLAAVGGLDWGPAGLGAREHLIVLAPGMDPTLGLRLVLAFAFAQSVHYAIWLRLVPEDDRERETPRTYGATFRALAADIGRVPMLLFVAGTIGVAAWALVDLVGARAGYLRATIFHGHLELAAFALIWTEGLRWTAAGSKRSH